MAANISQAALADAAGLSSVAISAYERGVRNAPRHDTLCRLADALRLRGSERDAFIASANMPIGAISSLPAEASSFVGREPEMLSLMDRVRAQPFTMLVGAAGVGKSRLATRFAAALERDGSTAAFIDVSAPSSGVSLAQRAAAILRQSGANIILLDACDGHASTVLSVAVTLAASSQDLAIVATSREAPGVPEEHIFPITPLDAGVSDPTTIDEGLASPAVRLFIERAQSYQPSFTLTLERVVQVAEICRNLNGVPLAIERAAARLPSLGLRRLRLRLGAG
jgi:predicted ATPase